MPRSLPLFLVAGLALLALGSIAWLVLEGGESAGESAGETDDADLSRGEAVSVEDPEMRVEAPSTSGLVGRAHAKDRIRRGPRWPLVPTDQIPRGRLDVLPLKPDGTPYAPNDVKVRLEREQTDFWATPLGVPDYESGVHRFSDVPIGKVRVIVFGDHVVRTVERAEILANQTSFEEVFADRAGAIRFQAKLYSGEAPAAITLELQAADTKRPVVAWWQVRSETVRSGPRRASRVVQGPEGWLIGVPQGRYILRAESEEGELDTPEVDVRLGETAEVEILLRK